MTNFLITRHGESCNNVDAGANTKGKDMDPTLTIYGIVSALVFSHFNSGIYQNNVTSIMVSNLVRTWITAFLLYGGKTTQKSFYDSRSDELNLYVCPYLRERIMETLATAQGNFPKPLHKTLERFLESLNNICQVIDNIPSVLLEKELSYFIASSNETQLLTYFDIFKNFCNNKVKTINIHIPKPKISTLMSVSPIEIILKNDKYVFKNTDIINIIKQAPQYDTVGATGVRAPNARLGIYSMYTSKSKNAYLNEGDLTEFGSWYNTQSVDEQWFGPNFKEDTTNNTNKVHIVGHSNVMVKYLGLTSLGWKNKELSKDSREYKKIWWSNLSRFESTFTRGHSELYFHVDEESIFPGTRILDEDSKKNHKEFSKGIENDNPGKTTCGVRRPKTFYTPLTNFFGTTPKRTVPVKINQVPVQGGKKSRKTKKTKKRGKTNKRKTRNFYK